uniref:Macaca fascicularis brain cDNA clone: QtrA-17437, similar to human hypothetical protein LOC129607 (LOC129607), mRNA, RefSeq: XM_059368.6 n=1 Tax=Macaca fascicularis TaxID=9541 RepID=I7GKS3_MACFA|nr:unnamed protein product [Macaca fascicularis]
MKGDFEVPIWATLPSWSQQKGEGNSRKREKLVHSVPPLFLKPGRCLTWSTSAQNRSRKESSRLLPSKDWMPRVKPR